MGIKKATLQARWKNFKLDSGEQTQAAVASHLFSQLE